MLEGASDRPGRRRRCGGRGFPADRLRTFMRDFPSRPSTSLWRWRRRTSAADEPIADAVVEDAEAPRSYEAAPPGEDEVEAPAPAARTRATTRPRRARGRSRAERDSICARPQRALGH